MNAAEDAGQGRWDSYVLTRGREVSSLWRDLARQLAGRTLFCLAGGFDPRMCNGLESFLETANPNATDVVLLEHPPSKRPIDEVTGSLRAQNDRRLEQLATSVSSVRNVSLPARDRDARSVAARSAVRLMPNAEELRSYRHVIVDVSALPRSIYFPLIGRLLDLADELSREKGRDAARRALNIHMMVTENATLDSSILDEGIGELAAYLPGFTGGLDREASADLSTIWIPLLGEGQTERLRRIYAHVNPAEICPVLPSPSRLPRRADDLVLEYHNLLFDQLRVEPRNILYASERNPFEVYRQLRKTVLRYESALTPIGGCKTALSALSSKLMSVGALLAAYELKRQGHLIGVAHLESESSSLMPEAAQSIPAIVSQSELFDLWIAGEAYEH